MKLFETVHQAQSIAALLVARSLSHVETTMFTPNGPGGSFNASNVGDIVPSYADNADGGAASIGCAVGSWARRNSSFAATPSAP